MKLLAIDIDDCLSDYTTPFIKFANSRDPKLHLTPQTIRGSFTEMGLLDHLRAFRESGALSNLAVVRGAQEAVAELKKHYNVVILTARDESVMLETHAWMGKYFPGLIIIFTLDKLKSLESINAFALIDDQVRWLKFHNSFAIAQPWNREFKGARGNWAEITKILVERNPKDGSKL